MKINKHIAGIDNPGHILSYCSFLIFYILSIRSVLVYLNYLTVPIQLIGGIAVVAGIVISWWKTTWVLCLFIVCIPLISGVQELGFMKSVPVVSFLFSIIYISWFTKFFFRQKKSPASEKTVSNLIDILSFLVYFSIISSIYSYPLDYSLYRLRYASVMGQQDPFWFMEAGYIVLQGMFLYRMFELELKNKKESKLIIPSIFGNAVIVLIFSFQEIIEKIINAKSFFFITRPFQEAHSYAGYLLILFFYFAYKAARETRNIEINVLLALSFFLCLFLSGSFVALLSATISGIIWGMIGFKKKHRKIILIACLVIGGVSLFYSIPQVKTDNLLIQRYATRLNYANVLNHDTVTMRLEFWDRAVEIIKEFPLTGSGVGSYLKTSRFYSNNLADASAFENAHNYYLQFAAELGIPALFLFLMILYFTYKAGVRTTSSVHSKGLLLGLSGYLFSMLTGHHLIISTQQFLFWFIMLAIAFSSNSGFEKTKPGVEKKYLSPVVSFLVAMVIAGHAFNSFYPGKEVKGRYEFGLYKPQVAGKDDMRWFNKFSRRKIYAKSDYLGFSMYAEPENIAIDSIEIEIFINDKLFDRVMWRKTGTQHKYYHVPGIKGQYLEIITLAGYSYNPYKNGLSQNIEENRHQSAAITDIVFFEIPITEGINTCTLFQTEE